MTCSKCKSKTKVQMDEINIYDYNYGDRLLLGVAKKDSIDGRYYLTKR